MVISKENQLSSGTGDICESWRRFALEEYHKRLLNLDAGQLRQAAKVAQMRCRYIHQLAEQRGETYFNYSQRITLGGSKTELISRLAEEAYEFLALEHLLYESPGIMGTSRKNTEVLSSSDSIGDASPDENSYSDSDSSEIIPRKRPKLEGNGEWGIGGVRGQSCGASTSAATSPHSNVATTECPSDICLSDSDFDSSSDDDLSLDLHETTCVAVDHCTETEQDAPYVPGGAVMSVDAVRRLCFGYDEFRTGQRYNQRMYAALF